MPFQMKIQPIDSWSQEGPLRKDPVKPVVKSRFKRLFELQLPCVLRISSTEKPGVEEHQYNKDGSGDLEPSSVCLAKMVQNFIEETNEKQSVASKCCRNRCNCLSRSCNGSPDDEFDSCCGSNDSIGDACEVLKSLVPCDSIAERNLLADTAKIIEMNKSCKLKADCRKIVSDGLLALGYDVAICKSRWEKCPSYPAGEYEYVDVIVDSERLLVDVDFRSEFEIARSTGNYKAVLQSLPSIFVGKADRLQQIVSIASEAAKQSLKKKGLHFPPWRKAEYMRAKWLSPYTRLAAAGATTTTKPTESEIEIEAEIKNKSCLVKTESFSGEFELLFSEKTVTTFQSKTDSGDHSSFSGGSSDGGAMSPLNLLPMKSRSSQGGLASVLEEKP
ncbi:Protein of unknown function DUF506 [Macleaya cordata]|uniref:DUF506 domain-containing protein n=1 Tax=Macleaya cordata TaxID=56857 RepID=A0A200Q4G0_MACCD|nr:Protein of unknown function DUF506 [Macleaya cordata]